MKKQKNTPRSRVFYAALLWILILVAVRPVFDPSPKKALAQSTQPLLFLPLLQSSNVPPVEPGTQPVVNIPYHGVGIRWPETAIFWFGQVTPSDNYADVRVALADDGIYLNLQIFDRFLVYKPGAQPADYWGYDSVSLFLDQSSDAAPAPQATAYRFDAMLNWYEDRAAYQVAYRGNGTAWQPAQIPFETLSMWSGNGAINDAAWDFGWRVTYVIPYTSLGLTSRPTEGTVWKLGIRLNDSDSPFGANGQVQTWPTDLDPDQSATWGLARLGLPQFMPPSGAVLAQTVSLRHGVNGVQVVDGMVGGSSTCEEGATDRWTEWGAFNWAGSTFANVQNEADVSDWVCYSKYYLTFPLGSLPPGREVISATLTLFQNGQAGGGSWGDSPNAFIQVLVVGEDWNESTLTWNNAPQPDENVSASWVAPVDTAGIPRSWDLSYALARAYTRGQPLRLVLYSSDMAYHTGRYFYTSDANQAVRPLLEVGLSGSK